MSHEYDYGFAVREASWHGLDNVVTDFPANALEAAELAFKRRDGKPGHWEPMTVPMAYQEMVVGDDGLPTNIWTPFPSQLAIVRDDAPGVLLGQTASGETSIIGNLTLLEVAEAMVLAGGEAKMHVEAAGSIMEGAQIFVTIILDEPVNIAGDDTPTVPFFVVTGAHTGNKASRAGYLFFRACCANTVNAANMIWDKGTLPSYTFRHTAGVQDRIEEAKAAMAGMRSVWAQFQELSNELVKLKVGKTELTNFIDTFIPMPATLEALTDRQKKNVMKARQTFQSLYTDSITTEGHRGTALGLVDAGVEFLDHVRRSTNQDTLVRRTLIEPDKFKTSVINLAREVCTA